MKHRHIANKNKNSEDFAIIFVIFGITYLLSNYIQTHIQAIFANNIDAISNHHWLHTLFNAHTAINSNMAITSCMISIHMDNLPNVLSVFHISSSSFNITMVLLNANQIHTYHAVIMSNHNNNDIQNHIAAVIST